MTDRELLESFIGVPYAKKQTIYTICNGTYSSASPECSKGIKKPICQQDYLKMESAPKDTMIRCPLGLYSYSCSVGKNDYILTGRRGRVAEIDYRKATQTLMLLFKRLSNLEDIVSERYTLALHEIIKLNGVVVADSERMLKPGNGLSDMHREKATRIFKTAHVMSTQFRIIDYLTNDTFMLLKPDRSRELYKIFDMFAKVYESREQKRKILLNVSETPYTRKFLCCEETFPIIPGALIQNALKYSIDDSPVKVNFSVEPGYCIATVTNDAILGTRFGDEVYEKGLRLRNDIPGTGMGLYLVKKIVEQHSASVSFTFRDIDAEKTEVSFTLKVPESH